MALSSGTALPSPQPLAQLWVQDHNPSLAPAQGAAQALAQARGSLQTVCCSPPILPVAPASPLLQVGFELQGPQPPSPAQAAAPSPVQLHRHRARQEMRKGCLSTVTSCPHRDPSLTSPCSAAPLTAPFLYGAAQLESHGILSPLQLPQVLTANSKASLPCLSSELLQWIPLIQE